MDLLQPLHQTLIKRIGEIYSYAMYFMPYIVYLSIVDSVVRFINDENMAPRDVFAPNGAQ
jgi:hypothetical protein